MKYIKKIDEGWNNDPEPPEYYVIRDYMFKLRNGKELDDSEKEDIDLFFKYPGLYDKLEIWLKEKFDIISKYNIEDIEDRLVEFFDKVSDWDPQVMFALHMRYSGGEGWSGIDSKKIGSRKYLLYEISHVIGDLLFHRPKKWRTDNVTVDDYFKNKKASLHIGFNRVNQSRKFYNLLFLEELMDKIVSRLSKLYNITNVKYDYSRDKRYYDPNTDVNDYTLTLIIE